MGRLLGRGSFAKVFAAYTIADGDKPVAIKIIDKTKTDSVMEPKIICEIKAMRRLQHHPNVLRILEVMATKTKIFIVMELAVGGDLFSKVVQRGRMPRPPRPRTGALTESSIPLAEPLLSPRLKSSTGAATTAPKPTPGPAG
ncbi:unnamed protein product [Linum tenue]|uniref:Protein kinase domain-containing protein n=1 Tax=Linum tenue TaxID=586396 RepID=A0AAV0P3Y3_9ROSI|nr:unnamed protein product [Linum tenue]